MPLTPSFKLVAKPNIRWENMFSQSFIQRWKSLCFGMHFSRTLKTGSSKTAGNYSNSSSFENTFSLLFWPYCFELKRITCFSQAHISIFSWAYHWPWKGRTLWPSLNIIQQSSFGIVSFLVQHLQNMSFRTAMLVS